MLAASVDGLRPQQRAAIAVVARDRWAAEADVARLQGPRAALVVDCCQVLQHRHAQRPDARRAAHRQRPHALRAARQGWRWRLGRHAAALDAAARPKRPRAGEIWPELARRTASRALDTGITTVQPTGHQTLLKWVETVRRWEQELLTEVDERITNGCVDGTHNNITLIKRRAFGFRNVENFRSRILHACGGL